METFARVGSAWLGPERALRAVSVNCYVRDVRTRRRVGEIGGILGRAYLASRKKCALAHRAAGENCGKIAARKARVAAARKAAEKTTLRARANYARGLADAREKEKEGGGGVIATRRFGNSIEGIW